MVMDNLAPRDGELYYWPHFLPPDTADTTLQTLQAELDWQQTVATIVGRHVPLPRLVCWHGDAAAIYRYSGLVHYPQPWTETLLRLKRDIEIATGQQFNSVLGNYYRTGSDSMGWHSDQEASLGLNPTIASLSLGAVRLFKLRHIKTDDTLDITLNHGSLLLMGGSLQHHWRHCLPKTRKPTAARINLTFRAIFPGR